MHNPGLSSELEIHHEQENYWRCCFFTIKYSRDTEANKQITLRGGGVAQLGEIWTKTEKPRAMLLMQVQLPSAARDLESFKINTLNSPFSNMKLRERVCVCERHSVVLAYACSMCVCVCVYVLSLHMPAA